jgi:hypothetical protein
MNQITFSLDTREFDKAMNELIVTGTKTPAEETNQRAMNVAVRAFNTIPPHDVAAKRAEVKAYMDRQISQKIKQNISGKNKGKFRKAGRKKDQLRLRHLIVQARRTKLGLKGLYGTPMRKAAGAFSQMAQASQGYLKSVFIPIISGLYPYVKYRPKAAFTIGSKMNPGSSVARWPGSAGSGRVTPAKDGSVKAVTLFETITKVISGQEPKVRLIQVMALVGAMRDETEEMKRHLIDRMNKTFRKVNPP